MTRGDLENQTKDEVISTALQLRRSNEGQAVQLLETERALVQMRAAEVEKYDGGRLLIEGAGGTIVVGGAGELINWFLAWLGTPPGNGAQQGMISAWVMRNFALLRSVPHILLGLALAVGTKPTPRSGMINDGRAMAIAFPHLVIFPCIAISTLMLGLSLLADGLDENAQQGARN